MAGGARAAAQCIRSGHRLGLQRSPAPDGSSTAGRHRAGRRGPRQEGGGPQGPTPMSLRMMTAGALLAVALSVLGCVHAKQTRAAEETAGGKSKAGKTRSETMETSKTTKKMFKAGGIARLQAALDEKLKRGAPVP